MSSEVVSVKQFCQLLYPGVPANLYPSGSGNINKNLFVRVNEGTDGKKIQSVFCDTINDNNLIPGFRIAEYESVQGPSGRLEARRDPCVFKSTDVPESRRPEYWRQCMPLEFRFDTDIFATQDPDSAAAHIRGELMKYAGRIMWLQHRTHLFMPLVFGHHARMLYWDRSGIVATEPFSYVEHPEHLCDLFYGFSQLSEAGQGLDPTITLVTEDMPEYDIMTVYAALETFPLDIGIQPGTALPADTNIDTATFRYVRIMFSRSLRTEGVEYDDAIIAPSAIWSRWMLTVPDSDRGERKYLVGLPFFSSTDVFGRATRCYVALDLEKRCFVVLKDVWRRLGEDREREGTILERLNAAGVRNIPTVLCHADLPGQETRCASILEQRRDAEAKEAAAREEEAKGTQAAAAQTDPSATIHLAPTRQHDGTTPHSSTVSPSTGLPVKPVFGTKRPREESTPEPVRPPPGVGHLSLRDGGGCPFRKHQHYRMVVKEVGIPLGAILSLKQLVEVMFDCAIAHKDACLKAGLMHCDLSVGNVLMYPRIEGGENGDSPEVRCYGILADWELSKPVGTKEARQPERAATWQFASVACMGDPRKDVEIPDELESLFNILLRVAIEQGVSNCDNIPVFIEGYFDRFHPRAGGSFTAPVLRRNTMRDGKLQCPELDLKFGSDDAPHPLDSIIASLLPLFKARYAVYNQSRVAAAAAPAAPATSAHSTQRTRAPVRTVKRYGDDGMRAALTKPTTPSGPTAEDRKLARTLDNHDVFCQLLITAIEESEWPENDVIEGELCLDGHGL